MGQCHVDPSDQAPQARVASPLDTDSLNPTVPFLIGGISLCQMIGFQLSTLLTQSQGAIWELRFRGLRIADISREIGKSRQYVSKSLQSADSRVYRALAEAARMNKVMIKTMDPEKGFLVGYTREFDSTVLITFSPKDGINIWRPHRGQCDGCPDENSCRAHLVGEADRLGVELRKVQHGLAGLFPQILGCSFRVRIPNVRVSEARSSERVEV